MMIKNKAWAYGIMRFADISQNQRLSFLLENAIIDCPYCKNTIIDDDLFWRILMDDDNSRKFLNRNHVFALEHLVSDYEEWYEMNLYDGHYKYGDDRFIYAY